MNLNKNTNCYQVFREGKKRSPWCEKRRESIGRILADGTFVFSKTYLLEAKLHGVLSEKEQTETKTEIVASNICAAVQSSGIETREEKFVSIPLAAIAMAAIMMALTGESDSVSISDYLSRNRSFFKKYISDCDFENVSHDTVRRALMLIEPDKFEAFYLKLLEPIIKRTVDRIIAVDGQAVRASASTTEDKPELHGAAMLMNVYDVGNRVCIGHQLIANKRNEITVGPGLLEGLNLFGSIVTADAMSCQIKFVDTVYKSADYCISLKGNQESSWKEAMYLFSTAREHIVSHTDECELDHGRIEQRSVEMLPGRFLSKELIHKWVGLAAGSIIRVHKTVTKKSTGEESSEERYYISSIPAFDGMPEKMGKVIRAHWGIENNLHWALDNLFRQDRMQADNPNYISNRSALNKLALALLENYRFYLWDKGEATKSLSLHILQERCRDPKTAIECIGYALGWFH